MLIIIFKITNYLGEFMVNFNPTEILTKINKDELILHLVGRVRKNSILCLTPTINTNVKDEIFRIIQNRINDRKNYKVDYYNIVGSLDGIVEKTTKSQYSSKFENILGSMSKPTTNDDIDINDCDFYVFEYKNADNTVYFFRRINKMRALKKGFIGTINNGTFTKLDSDNFVGIDNDIDFILYDDEIYILNHISFERILKLSDEFKEAAVKVLNNDVFKKRIENFDKLKSKALENRNYVKRLAKLKNDNFTLFLDKIDKTKKVIEQFNLDIEVKKDKLVFRDDSQVGNFINLMQDSYYRTLIGDHNGIDERK